MVDLALLQSVSYIAGALGVCVAAVYYMMNLQMTRRKMKIDNSILYGNLIATKEMVLQWRHVIYEQQFQSFDEWSEKYRTDPIAYSNVISTIGLMGQMGMCVKEDLADFDMLSKRSLVTWTLAVYPKIKVVINGIRVLYGDPLYGFYCDYLYEEVMKRYPSSDRLGEHVLPQ